MCLLGMTMHTRTILGEEIKVRTIHSGKNYVLRLLAEIQQALGVIHKWRHANLNFTIPTPSSITLQQLFYLHP